MQKKAIIFDVDGVITDSGANKEEIIKNILIRYSLFDIPGVSEIFGIGLNRKLLLQKIYEIKEFDRERVLGDINRELLMLENSVIPIAETKDFIIENHETYLMFTNTSLPKSSLKDIFQRLDMGQYFMELLAYDDGSKKENIEYVKEVYDLESENILFIDDKQSHIDAVKDTGVHTLLFVHDGVSLEEKIKNF